MNKIFIVFGAAALALGIAQESAEARKISYDIGGKTYTYESGDPQQVESARKRIEAANEADAARAKAEAERASSPLVSVFGSPVQTEAAEAQARLLQVQAAQDQADAARQQERAAQATREPQHRRPDDQQALQSDNGESPDRAVTQTEKAAAEPARDPHADAEGAEKPKSMVKSVSFDVESGIKRTVMSDGTVEEEPFDSNMLARLASEHDSSGSLTAFVNQIRKTAPSETTGSTASASALAPAPIHLQRP